MRERPIVFSSPMVRAILAGTKTQTRRVMKPQPVEMTGAAKGGILHEPCRYGTPSDHLWVREAWADLTESHGQPWERYNPQTRLYERGKSPFVWYRADGEQPGAGSGDEPGTERWRPSIHMPRWASRITLEVTGVRVERLQEISEADAIAEGVEPVLYPPDGGDAPHVEGFRDLWSWINGAGLWEANPWVWVVEFKRVQP